MILDLANLPHDPDLLKRVVLDLVEALKQREHKIENLEHRIQQLLRQAYGRKSEQLDPDQLRLAFAELLANPQDPPAAAAAAPQPPASDPSKKGHGRSRPPRDLPRRRVEHRLPEADKQCGKCGASLTKIDEETCEQLEYVPASFVVIEHVREKYACKACEQTIVTSRMPPQPIEKGLPGPGLLAHVATSKYADHLPLHRLEGIFARHGVEIARSTMCDWMGACADLAAPLYDALKGDVIGSAVVHTDDTPVPVQDRERDRTRIARLWVYVGDKDHPHVVFDFTPTRSRDGPNAFLGGYAGYLQADAYAGYDGIYAGGKVAEVACWAHARRKFYDARESGKVAANVALAFIRKLYDVEDAAKELSADERRELRQQRARPVLDPLKLWLDEEARRSLPKSAMGQAIGYVRGQWAGLCRYIEDGRLSIDNNAAERELRAVAVGRKNWTFAGSDEGGRRAAIIYSLVASAKRAGLDPFVYMRDLFRRLPTHPKDRMAELMPSRWKLVDAAAENSSAS